MVLAGSAGALAVGSLENEALLLAGVGRSIFLIAVVGQGLVEEPSGTFESADSEMPRRLSSSGRL